MLPKGSAKKVTIYLNQDTRIHIEPLWSAVLEFLRHKHVAGATLLRADAGFGAHEQFHNPRSEYSAEHSPVRIEFVETPERVDELLPTLYEMVTDGLITVQDLTVVKCCAKDAKTRRTEPGSAKKVVSTPAKLVRIYLGESDKCKDEPLYGAIVKKLRMMDFAGATVYRGVLGYAQGPHAQGWAIPFVARSAHHDFGCRKAGQSGRTGAGCGRDDAGRDYCHVGRRTSPHRARTT